MSDTTAIEDLIALATSLEETSARLLKASADIPTRADKAVSRIEAAAAGAEVALTATAHKTKSIHDAGVAELKAIIAKHDATATDALRDLGETRAAMQRDLLAAIQPELNAGTSRIAETTTEAANTIARRASEFESALVKHGAETAQRIEAAATRLAWNRWLAWGGALGMIVLAGGAGWIGWTFGAQHERQAIGDEKAALAWSSTPDGKAAWKLAQLNDSDTMQAIAKCTAPGWKTETKNGFVMCWPYGAGDGMHGWAIKQAN